MKSTKRILIATVAALLLCATFVTGALALVAGENTTLEEYTQSGVIIEDDFNDGEMEYSRNGNQIFGANTGEESFKRGEMFHAHPPTGYEEHKGDAGRIETDGAGVDRNGADNVYTSADESNDENNYYYNVNYSKKNNENVHFFFTWMLSNLSDSDGITRAGYIIEFDVNLWFPVKDVQTAGQNTPDDTTDDVWEKQVDADSWVCPPVHFDVMNSTTGSAGSVHLFDFVQAKEDGTDKKGYVSIVTKTNESITFPANTWQHITIQFDSVGIYRVYVGRDTDTDGEGNVIGRQLLTEKSFVSNDKQVYPATIRVGPDAEVQKGELAIDNFLSYQGVSVHNPHLFDNMTTDGEAVIYLVEILKIESATAAVKNSAYEMISNTYLSMFWDGTQFLGTADDDVKEALTYFLDFKENGYPQMIEALRRENSIHYAELVMQLDAMPRTLSNIGSRNDMVKAIQSFLLSAGGTIDRGIQEFKDAEVIFSTNRMEIERDKNSLELINQMNAFQKAYGIYAVSAMERRFNIATEAYKNCTEAGVFAENSDDAKKLADAIKLYEEASAIMAMVLKDVNSERFINLVGLYKNTDEQDWESDDGTIRRYWYLSRSILLDTESYNPDYDGMAAALIEYERVNAYFWAVMQEEHIAILEAKLANFNKPNVAYIEQLGACTFVNNYIERNKADIDPNNEQINNLVKISKGYETILSTIKDDYHKSLVQNKEKFIHTMNLVSATKGYANIMPLFEEATALYYSMNIEGDAAKAAVAEYERIRSELINIAADSTLFIAKVAELAAEKDADKAFRILSECYACLDNLDETYEGVAAAKAIYDAKMAEQEAAVVSNAEIEETAEVICSVRSLDAGLDIIKLLKNLLGI